MSKKFQLISSKDPRNFEGAQRACDLNGGRLASIHNFMEQMEVEKLAGKRTKAFPIATGMKQSINDNTQFVDGDEVPLNFT